MKSEELALLDRLVDDRLLPGDRELINELLIDKPAFRRLFVTYLDLHNSLGWLEPDLEATSTAPAVVAEPTGRPFGSSRHWWSIVAAAAIVITGTTIVHRLATPPAPTTILTDSAPGFTGRLSIPAGTSNLQLANGTKLEVIGPAELIVAADQSVDLNSGRLGVELPPDVDHFRLRTPTVEVVDLGTAFLTAANAEQTVVAVRQGAVRVFAGDDTVDMAAGTSAVFKKDAGVNRFPLDLEDQHYLEQAFVAGLDIAPVRLSGAARWVDPDQIPDSNAQRDHDMLVTLVRRNWALPADQPALAATPGFVDQFNPELPAATIAAGTRVDVYRIYYAPTRNDRGLAAIEFPTPIVGIVATTEHLQAFDALLQQRRQDASQHGRGLESRTGKERNHDAVNLHRNRRHVTIAMAVNDKHADETVILVASPTTP